MACVAIDSAEGERREGPILITTCFKMMGGGRNGRYFKWVIGVALFLSLVYVLYLYRGMKILLQERDQQLEDLNNANKRVAEELRGMRDYSESRSRGSLVLTRGESLPARLHEVVMYKIPCLYFPSPSIETAC